MDCINDRLTLQPAVPESPEFSAERPRLTLARLIQTLAAEGLVELVVKQSSGRRHRIQIRHLPDAGTGEQETTPAQGSGDRTDGPDSRVLTTAQEPAGPTAALPDAAGGGGERAEVVDCHGVLGSWYPRRNFGYIFNGGGGPWHASAVDFLPEEFSALEAEIARRVGARPWPDRITGLHLPVRFHSQELQTGERFPPAKRIRLIKGQENHARIALRSTRLPLPEIAMDDNFAPRGRKPWEEAD